MKMCTINTEKIETLNLTSITLKHAYSPTRSSRPFIKFKLKAFLTYFAILIKIADS